MRFDDRVTGDLRTYARNARKIHIEVDRSEINKNVKVDAAIIGDAGETLANLLPHVHERDHSEWLAHIKELKGDVGGARHSILAGQRTSLRRARD